MLLFGAPNLVSIPGTAATSNTVPFTRLCWDWRVESAVDAGTLKRLPQYKLRLVHDSVSDTRLAGAHTKGLVISGTQ